MNSQSILRVASLLQYLLTTEPFLSFRATCTLEQRKKSHILVRLLLTNQVWLRKLYLENSQDIMNDNLVRRVYSLSKLRIDYYRGIILDLVAILILIWLLYLVIIVDLVVHELKLLFLKDMLRI